MCKDRERKREEEKQNEKKAGGIVKKVVAGALGFIGLVSAGTYLMDSIMIVYFRSLVLVIFLTCSLEQVLAEVSGAAIQQGRGEGRQGVQILLRISR